MPLTNWAEHTICTPELMRASAAFDLGAVSDDEVLQLYGAALARDWKLFSGAQAAWAAKELANGSNTRFALALVALSGMTEWLTALEGTDGHAWNEADRALLARTRQFVLTHGRTTTLDEASKIGPVRFSRETMLAYPAAPNQQRQAYGEVPPRSRVLDRFFAQNGGIDKSGSMAPMMAASLYLRHTDEVALSLIADLLIQDKQYDAALAYAKMGKSKGGLSSVLDNTIGNVLSAQGKFSEAIEHYQLSLQAGRVDGWPEINMAMNYARLDQSQAAEKWFRAGLARQTTARSTSEYARYLNEFAWFLITKQPQSKASVAEALKLSQLSNNLVRYSDANYLDTLAECLYRSGDAQAALKASEAATKLTDDPAEAARLRDRLAQFQSRATKR